MPVTSAEGLSASDFDFVLSVPLSVTDPVQKTMSNAVTVSE